MTTITNPYIGVKARKLVREPPPPKPVQLPARQAAILELLKRHPKTTVNELSGFSDGITPQKVQVHLTALRFRGLVKRVGYRNGHGRQRIGRGYLWVIENKAKEVT